MHTLPNLTLDRDAGLLPPSDVAALAAQISNGTLNPADDSCDEARKVWNATVDRHPALIARCLTTIDVQTATYRALAETRFFFAELLEGGTNGFLGTFKMKRQEVAGELACIVWEAEPWFASATDTILVRDGMSMLQTFAAYTARAP